MAKGGPEGGGGGADNSLDLLWGAAIFLAVIFLSWYFGKVYITAFIFKIKFGEIFAIKFVLNWLNLALSFIGFHISERPIDQALAFITSNYGEALQFQNVVAVCVIVGEYLRIPLIFFIVIGAALLHFGGVSHRYRHTFNTKSLKLIEKDGWPQITPVLGCDLVNQQLDTGPWAMALSPMAFCKKNNLLNIEKKDGRYIVSLKYGAAYRVLTLQLSVKWRGPEVLPIHLKALFAIFAARIAEDKKPTEVLLDRIAASAAHQKLDFSGVEELFAKHKNNKKVLRICSLHGYATTVLASMFVAAREFGVLATSEFIWLKTIDRRAWYALNCVGRPTAFAEVCGIYAHWLAERKIGLPLVAPMVEEAVNGLAVSLTDIIYKPDDED